MNRHFEMQDLDGPMSPAQVRRAPIVLVLIAATMLGAASGILVADRNALLPLEKKFMAQIARIRSSLFGGAEAASAKKETPKVIPIGISSIISLSYSFKPDSAHMAFDLEAAEVVQTGKLRSPDRIYFDLRDRSREQGTARQLKTQKAVNIAGDLLTGIRISPRKPGVTRMVLDLKHPCDFTYQTSPGSPSRLVVELRPLPTEAPDPK